MYSGSAIVINNLAKSYVYRNDILICGIFLLDRFAFLPFRFRTYAAVIVMLE